jgi:hypothetical protein
MRNKVEDILEMQIATKVKRHHPIIWIWCEVKTAKESVGRVLETGSYIITQPLTACRRHIWRGPLWGNWGSAVADHLLFGL